MTVSTPEHVLARGHWTAWFVPAAATPTAITMAELTAGVNITPYMPDPAWDGIGGDVERLEQTRANLTESFQVNGQITRSLADISYTVMPQSLPTDVANKVSTALAEKATGYIVIRRGPLSDVAAASTQKYSAVKVEVVLQKENLGTAEAPLTNTSSFNIVGALIKGTFAA